MFTSTVSDIWINLYGIYLLCSKISHPMSCAHLVLMIFFRFFLPKTRTIVCTNVVKFHSSVWCSLANRDRICSKIWCVFPNDSIKCPFKFSLQKLSYFVWHYFIVLLHMLCCQGSCLILPQQFKPKQMLSCFFSYRNY